MESETRKCRVSTLRPCSYWMLPTAIKAGPDWCVKMDSFPCVLSLHESKATRFSENRVFYKKHPKFVLMDERESTIVHYKFMWQIKHCKTLHRNAHRCFIDEVNLTMQLKKAWTCKKGEKYETTLIVSYCFNGFVNQRYVPVLLIIYSTRQLHLDLTVNHWFKWIHFGLQTMHIWIPRAPMRPFNVSSLNLKRGIKYGQIVNKNIITSSKHMIHIYFIIKWIFIYQF